MWCQVLGEDALDVDFMSVGAIEAREHEIEEYMGYDEYYTGPRPSYLPKSQKAQLPVFDYNTESTEGV